MTKESQRREHPAGGYAKNLEAGESMRDNAAAAPPAALTGEPPMLDGRLIGPLLLLLGSGFLIFPEAFLPWLSLQEGALAGFASIALGLAASLVGWRGELADASFHAHAAMRHMAAGRGSAGPAKRLRIRIRCAR